MVLPEDVAIADRFDAEAAAKIVPIDEVPPEGHILDVGPRYDKEIRKSP